MSEIMLRDTAEAYGMRYVMLRYFNVAGSDPLQRTGHSTLGATHVIKVACEAALGKRSHMKIFGTDYDTPDGSCIRDFIHVSDLVAAHYSALVFLRQGGRKFTANCGYSRGYSVLEVVEFGEARLGPGFPCGARWAQARGHPVHGCEFAPNPVAHSIGSPDTTISISSSRRRSPGKKSSARWEPRCLFRPKKSEFRQHVAA